MCRVTEAPSSSTAQKKSIGGTSSNNGKLLLHSVESFETEDGQRPSTKSMVFTGATIIAFLVMIELTLREVLNSYQVCVKDVIFLSVCEFFDEICSGGLGILSMFLGWH